MYRMQLLTYRWCAQTNDLVLFNVDSHGIKRSIQVIYSIYDQTKLNRWKKKNNKAELSVHALICNEQVLKRCNNFAHLYLVTETLLTLLVPYYVSLRFLCVCSWPKKQHNTLLLRSRNLIILDGFSFGLHWLVAYDFVCAKKKNTQWFEI